MKVKFGTTFALAAFAFTASADAPWSDTPVTCHWIGEVYGGTTTDGDFASWTNPDNWEEGIVPGLSIADGVTNGCLGCTAVFDRPCKYPAVDFLYNPRILAISNIVVTGSAVPKITLGRPWQWNNPYLYLERGGGIYVSSDVAVAPEMRASIMYLRGANGPVTTFTFENNSATPFILKGFNGPDVAFKSYAGVITYRIKGTGEIRQTGTYSRSLFNLAVKLDMNGGKYVHAAGGSVDMI